MCAEAKKLASRTLRKRKSCGQELNIRCFLTGNHDPVQDDSSKVLIMCCGDKRAIWQISRTEVLSNLYECHLQETSDLVSGRLLRSQHLTPARHVREMG